MTHFAQHEDYAERPERLITGVAWDVHAIELREGKWLLARWPTEKRDVRRASVPSGGLLRRFCKLKDGTPRQIAAFAKRFGLLYLCEEHKLPQGHETGCEPRILVGPDGGYEGYADDVEDWRQWARRFEGTIEIARALLNRTLPTPQDVDETFEGLHRRWTQVSDMLRRPRWHDVQSFATTADGREIVNPPLVWKPPPLRVQLYFLTQWLNALLENASVRPQVAQLVNSHSLAVIDGSRPSPLFGALVVELAAQCAHVRTLARCRKCRKGFTPKRLSSAYCSRCGIPRIRWQIAQQKRRDRLRAAGLSARGRPFAKVDREMDVP